MPVIFQRSGGSQLCAFWIGARCYAAIVAKTVLQRHYRGIVTISFDHPEMELLGVASFRLMRRRSFKSQYFFRDFSAAASCFVLHEPERTTGQILRGCDIENTVCLNENRAKTRDN